MYVDEERDFVLTKYCTRKGVIKIVKSDHNPMWCEFNLEWSSFLKAEKQEIFNFKDVESQKAFKEYNDKNDKLVNHLTDSVDIVSGGRKWFGEVKDSIYKCFEKIRISKQNKDKNVHNLLEEKTQILKEIQRAKNSPISLNIMELQRKLKEVESMVASYSETRNLNKMSKHIEALTVQGKFNNTQMWKLRRKLCPKNVEKPSAKLNEKGKLITEKKQLLNLYKQTYIQRLSHRQSIR